MVRKHQHRPGGPAWQHSHHEHGLERVRFGGSSSQKGTPTIVSPFGGMPNQQARGTKEQFADPFSAYFGIAPDEGTKAGNRYQDIMSRIGGSDSPVAQYMRQAGGFLPQVFGQAQGIGQQIASMAPGLFDLLRSQIGQSMGSIPGLQQQAGQASNLAGQAAQQAFSPIASQAMYQNALRNSLDASRQGASARGMLDSGGQQGMEDTMGRDLAAQFAAAQFGQQQQALQGQQQALGTQAGLLQMGPALAQQLSGALPGLQQALMAGYQTPMDAISQVFQQIASFQNPQLALLGLTAPQVAQKTSGSTMNIL